MKKHLVPLLLLAASLSACHPSEPKVSILSQQEMVRFLTEASLIEALYSVNTKYIYDTVDTNLSRAYDDLLLRMNISREQVDSSLQYYAARPDIYTRIQEEVVSALSTDTLP